MTDSMEGHEYIQPPDLRSPEDHDAAAEYFQELLQEETENPLDDNGTGKAAARLYRWKAEIAYNREAAERKRKAQAE